MKESAANEGSGPAESLQKNSGKQRPRAAMSGPYPSLFWERRERAGRGVSQGVATMPTTTTVSPEGCGAECRLIIHSEGAGG